jgi:hypothetical protein
MKKIISWLLIPGYMFYRYVVNEFPKIKGWEEVITYLLGLFIQSGYMIAYILLFLALLITLGIVK